MEEMPSRMSFSVSSIVVSGRGRGDDEETTCAVVGIN
jgi:hypothetical protein